MGVSGVECYGVTCHLILAACGFCSYILFWVGWMARGGGVWSKMEGARAVMSQGLRFGVNLESNMQDRLKSRN